MEAQTRYIDLSDWSDLVNLSDPQLSPDGSKIVFVVSRPDFEENRYKNELVLIDVATGAQQVLTYNRPQVRHPRWSPSGDRLAFLDTPEAEKTQLFVMSMSGGEAKCITSAPCGVDWFVWKPDGKELAFVTQDEPEEQTGEERHNKSFEVGDHDYLATAAPMPSHIWLVSANGDTTRRLTAGIAGVMSHTVVPSAPIAWSPDGDWLVFASQPRPHSGEKVHGSVKMLEIETETVRTLVPGPTYPTSPSFSPDGKYLAYARPQSPGPVFNPHGIYIIPIFGGEEANVTDTIDRSFYSARWLPDGKAILVDGYDHTQASIWVQPLKGAPRRLDLGPIHPAGGSVNIGSDGALVFIGSQSQHPAELYYMPSLEAQPRRLTEFNAPLASLQFGQVESIIWEGPDDFEEDGVLIYPPDFKASERYPLVLYIHGGPMGTTTEAFNLVGQLMAARGWIVFSPNYRGSSNLGGKYQRAVIHDAGDGPGRDVMAGIAAVKKRGFVDEARIAVSGWSYGGYMTTWLISHYPGWAVAVAGAAVTDYADSYNLSDVNVMFGAGFKYSPWVKDGAKVWREQSPITYVANITTPTLILSNTGDLRVPITQSYKLYHALKENDVQVKFIAYPVSGHFPDDPVHQRDVYRRWLDWIEQHFEGSDATSSLSEKDFGSFR